ncbi:FERM, ARHGEF and pleckstrin domain-containing protein 2 [Chionoecetes opilio]|uniref:FERM, ARHGEF and pleckstrin domain-containing protein 2 n=1 Tax=Chionoecetes opilio TaxID=41210 RepID=A0A8J4XW67_CHIOP|nr:FERM, ARHGEF and pleckstrin domain-containing protein 2 [Chionoecetes opilio]
MHQHRPWSPPAPGPTKQPSTHTSAPRLPHHGRGTGHVGARLSVAHGLPGATTPLSPHKENIPVSNHVNNRVDSIPNGHDTSARVGEMEGESRKRKYPSDKAYFVAKEILTTERTYKKDLEVISLWLKEEVGKEEGMPGEILTSLFQLIDPIYEFHTEFLKELDNRLAQW